MSRVRLLFSEAWSSISQNISTTFAATMTVLIGMFLLGLFIALGTWVLSWSDHVKKELQVKVYFTRRGDAGAGIRGRRRSCARTRSVKTRRLRLEGEGGEDMAKKFPELYKTPLPSNPLPDSWVITPVKAEYTPVLGRKILRAHYPGVEQGRQGVRWGSKTANRVLTIAEVIWIVFLVAVDPARHGVDAADREHDPAVDLRAAA